MNVGVIGFGYWGVNVTRNFLQNRAIQQVTVTDTNPRRAQAAKDLFPSVQIAASAEEIFKNPEIELVAVVTPVWTHFELARAALEHGKHVLVEKPLCHNSAAAQELVRLAQANDRVLAVDHTFIYTPVVQRIRELVANNTLGDLWYFDSVRINLGLFQHDVNVVWDLAVHDLSILLHVTNKRPVAVSVHGTAHTSTGMEDLAHINLHYADSFTAHMHVNWLAPTKIRQVIIGGASKMLVWDDLNPTEKLRIYDKGISFSENTQLDPQKATKELIKYRTGDIWSPALDQTEALSALTDALVGAIRRKEEFPTSGARGLEVVNLLEACQKSLEQKGTRIPIDYLS